MTRLPAIAVVGLQCVACAHAQTNLAFRTNRLAPPVHLRLTNSATSTNQPRSVTTVPGKVWRVRQNKMVLEDDGVTTNAVAAGVRTNSVPPLQR